MLRTRNSDGLSSRKHLRVSAMLATIFCVGCRTSPWEPTLALTPPPGIVFPALWEQRGGAVLGYVSTEDRSRPEAMFAYLTPRFARKEPGEIPHALVSTDGWFLLAPVEPGSYFLEIRAIGFRHFSTGLRILTGKTDTVAINLQLGRRVKAILIP